MGWRVEGLGDGLSRCRAWAMGWRVEGLGDGLSRCRA